MKRAFITISIISFVLFYSCNDKKELSSFELMNNKIEESNEINSIKNGTLLDVIYNKAKNDEEFARFKETADKVHEISNTFNSYLADLKKIVKEKESTEFVDELFFNGNEISDEGDEFLNYIENYKNSLISTIALTNPDVVGMVKSTFDIGSIEDRKGKQTNWLTLNYKGFPPVATVVKLSKMQADIKRIETEFYSSLLKVKLKKTSGYGSGSITEKPSLADNSINENSENEVSDIVDIEKTIEQSSNNNEESNTNVEKPNVKEDLVQQTKNSKTVEIEKPQASEAINSKYHVVKKGETLYRISLQYKVSPDFIRKLNGMKDNTLIVGNKIRIAK
jgi:LysM repeat protein